MALGSTAGLILGGLGAAGSIAGGLFGAGGAGAAAGAAQQGASQAYAANNAQLQRNYAALSPYMSAGQGATGILGQLLGLGTLTGNPDGVGSSFQNDPNSMKAGQNVLASYIKGSGIAAPTFKPVTEVTDKYTEDPGYGFRLTEGMRALDRTAASKGKLLSGQQFKAAQDYNSGLASQEYGNWFQRLMAQNAYNWGGQKDQFGLQYGQYRDALGDYFNMAGIGSGAANALTGANTSLAGNTSNALMGGAQMAGNAYQNGANAIGSAIGSGVNNALTGYFLGNYLGKSGGNYNGLGMQPLPQGASSHNLWGRVGG